MRLLIIIFLLLSIANAVDFEVNFNKTKLNEHTVDKNFYTLHFKQIYSSGGFGSEYNIPRCRYYDIDYHRNDTIKDLRDEKIRFKRISSENFTTKYSAIFGEKFLREEKLSSSSEDDYRKRKKELVPMFEKMYVLEVDAKNAKEAYEYFLSKNKGNVHLLDICFPLKMSNKDLGKPVAKIKSIAGSAQARRSDGSIEILKQNSKLYNKDLISTKMDSRISIIFTDGSIVKLGENSHISIDDYEYKKTKKDSFKTRVFGGLFEFVTGQMKKLNPDAFELTTAGSVIGIRGTRFIVQLAPVTLEPLVLKERYIVREGEISVKNLKNNKEIYIKANQAAYLEDGKLSDVYDVNSSKETMDLLNVVKLLFDGLDKSAKNQSFFTNEIDKKGQN
ncbi:MAG: FecR domain-containing protein [Campylobacterales bacterium]